MKKAEHRAVPVEAAMPDPPTPAPEREEPEVEGEGEEEGAAMEVVKPKGRKTGRTVSKFKKSGAPIAAKKLKGKKRFA